MRDARGRDAEERDAAARRDAAPQATGAAIQAPLAARESPALLSRAAVLGLQRSAGNHVVSALLARQDAGTAVAPGPASAGSGGAGLVDPQAQAAPYLSQLPLATSLEIARAHRQLKVPPDARGKILLYLPRGCYEIDAAVADVLRPVVRERKEAIFSAFAAGRAPLFTAMLSTTDAAARRTAAIALRAYDQPRLADLRPIQRELGGIWDIDDRASRDAVLAALQLEAATTAEGDLLLDSDEVHRRVWQSAGMAANHDWCGFFVQDNFVRTGLDRDLRSGFFHTNNVQDYFRYQYDRNPDRIRRWIWADGAWQNLRAYHNTRGSERQWLDYAALSAGGGLDIRPGDVALVDVGLNGDPNHIVMVQSYDAATSRLITVGGNDGGLVVDSAPAGRARRETAAQQESRERRQGATGQQLTQGAAGGHVGVSEHEVAAAGTRRGAIFGVGRPSIVDFEDHRYDGSLRAPAPLRP